MQVKINREEIGHSAAIFGILYMQEAFLAHTEEIGEVYRLWPIALKAISDEKRKSSSGI